MFWGERVEGVKHTGGHDARVEGNHLLLIKKVVNVLVEDHLANRLQRELVLRKDLGSIQRVKVILVLICNLHGLDVQLPFWEFTCTYKTVRLISTQGSSQAYASCKGHMHTTMSISNMPIGTTILRDITLESALCDLPRTLIGVHLSVITRQASKGTEDNTSSKSNKMKRVRVSKAMGLVSGWGGNLCGRQALPLSHRGHRQPCLCEEQEHKQEVTGLYLTRCCSRGPRWHGSAHCWLHQPAWPLHQSTP